MLDMVLTGLIVLLIWLNVRTANKYMHEWRLNRVRYIENRLKAYGEIPAVMFDELAELKAEIKEWDRKHGIDSNF